MEEKRRITLTKQELMELAHKRFSHYEVYLPPAEINYYSCGLCGNKVFQRRQLGYRMESFVHLHCGSCLAIHSICKRCANKYLINSQKEADYVLHGKYME